MSWYNPFSWFGYNDPDTGEFIEVNSIDGGGSTKSGVVVSGKQAISIPVVWACIRLISGTVSTLPLKLYAEKDGKKEAQKKPLILKRVNGFTTIGVFLESVLIWLLLRGNHYSLIERRKNGDVIAFLPLKYEQVEPKIIDGGLIYVVTLENGEQTPVSPENMLHFKIFSDDGITGLSLVDHLKETLGLLTSARDYSSYHMANGGFSGGLVIYESFLNRDQRGAVAERFKTIKQDGTKDLAKLVVLEGNPTFIPRNMSQKDAQFLESRSFDVVELCGALGVPPHMIGRTEKSTSWGTGIEQQNIGFVTYTLRYYLNRIEEELNEKVFTDSYCEFSVNGLLRGDSAARATFYTAALGGSGGSGWMSQNEIRKLENLSPIKDGDNVTVWSMSNAENDSTV